MKQLTLFDEMSNNVVSKAFSIFPGSVAVLSAYNLGKKVNLEPNEPTNTLQMVIVQKIHFSGGGIYSEKDMCCCADDAPLGFDPDLMYVEDMTQCGVWNLNACQNTGAIMLPGTYRVRLNDTGALGNCLVSLVRYTQEDAGVVPRGLIFGE